MTSLRVHARTGAPGNLLLNVRAEAFQDMGTDGTMFDLSV